MILLCNFVRLLQPVKILIWPQKEQNVDCWCSSVLNISHPQSSYLVYFVVRVCCQKDGSFLFNTYIAIDRFFCRHLLQLLGDERFVHCTSRTERQPVCARNPSLLGSKWVMWSHWNNTGKLIHRPQTSAESGFQEMPDLGWMETGSRSCQEAAGGLCCHGARSQRGPAAPGRARLGWVYICFPGVPVLCSWGGLVNVVRCCNVECASALGLVNGQLLVVFSANK